MLQTAGPARRSILAGGLALPAAALLTPARAEAAGIDSRTRLTDALDDYLATRNVRLGLHLYDRRDRSYYSYRPFTNQTLSTIKVLVAMTVLRRHQERGTTPTEYQRSLMQKMICNSDNGATDRLIAYVGIATIRRVADDIHLDQTTVQGGSYGPDWWGYSTSTPRDLLRLEMKLVWGQYLTSTNRSYLRGLMANVVSSQRWGVCDPPLPTGLRTEVKNGWGPLSSGYRLNSVGYVIGYGRQYAMSIVSRSPDGFSHGQATVNRVSRMVYDALDQPLT